MKTSNNLLYLEASKLLKQYDKEAQFQLKKNGRLIGKEAGSPFS